VVTASSAGRSWAASIQPVIGGGLDRLDVSGSRVQGQPHQAARAADKQMRHWLPGDRITVLLAGQHQHPRHHVLDGAEAGRGHHRRSGRKSVGEGNTQADEASPVPEARHRPCSMAPTRGADGSARNWGAGRFKRQPWRSRRSAPLQNLS
jgi:hypothetical protein